MRIYGASTIMRYIAERYQMNGMNEKEKAMIDMWCEYMDEVN